MMQCQGNCLPEKEMDQFVIELPVGLVAHGKIQPGFLVHDAFRVGKGEKAGFSVIRAHAAFAESAEAHIAGCQMDKNIVNAAATETAPGSHFPGGFFVTGENIES